MKRKIVYTLLPLILIFGFTLTAFAEMGSENYRIPTSVLCGGGGSMNSHNYQSDAILGQSSPLMDPNNPPSSASYNLYPGFWYTIESGCPGDFNNDGKIELVAAVVVKEGSIAFMTPKSTIIAYELKP